jgi:cation diffusion facilitator CzcD-associated flavoprotein CzcO
MAETAGHVTMLQRSPTYIVPVPSEDRLANTLPKLIGRNRAYAITRRKNIAKQRVVWRFCQQYPRAARRLIRHLNAKQLPAGYPVDEHFRPAYNPWDQRLCLIPDADLYVAIGDGRAEVVTDHIDHFDSTGIALKSGEHLDADIIVTATGLQLQALGGVVVSLDGAEIKPQDRFVYKAHMLEEVPNLFWCVGYTNASWTLRADMTARATAKLLAHMKSHGHTHAYPHLDGEPMPEKSAWDIQAGYVLRAPHALPKSGIKRPWNVRQNYYADVIDYRFDRITEAMVFGRAEKTALAG